MSPAAVIFDVDDTLYPERSFVHGAMSCVAAFLAQRTRRSVEHWERALLETLEAHGRGAVFDRVLTEHGLPTSWAPLLVHVYRCSSPPLSLYPDAAPLLDALLADGLRLGAVTDGLSLVQETKVKSLGLRRWMDAVVLTGALPEGCAKPSPVPFTCVLAMLDVHPERAVYVANDASKDFQGPAALGMATMFVTRSALSWRRESGKAVADVMVPHLADALGPVRDLLGVAGGPHGDRR